MINLLLITLYLVTAAVSVSETVFYSGFIQKHFYTSSTVIYITFLIISLYLILRYKNINKLFGIELYKLYLMLSVFFGFLYFLLMFLEKVTYNNFVFSHFHLHPDQLVWTFFISMFSFYITKKISTNKSGGSMLLGKLFRLESLIIPILIIIFMNNILDIASISKNDLLYLIKNPSATYDQKMEFKVGKTFYDYVLFVKNNTSPRSKILIPPWPAYPWPQSGNAVYLRYFLYPRQLVSGTEYSANVDLAKEKFDYVLIAWGETPTTSGNYTHGWPKFDVKADKIIFWDIFSGTILSKKENYTYEQVKGKVLWGLIKVSK